MALIARAAEGSVRDGQSLLDQAIVQAERGETVATAVVRDMRYQGTQTIYDLDLLGSRIETLELGTAARHPVGSEVALTLPPALTWAYAAP